MARKVVGWIDANNVEDGSPIEACRYVVCTYEGEELGTLLTETQLEGVLMLASGLGLDVYVRTEVLVGIPETPSGLGGSLIHHA